MDLITHGLFAACCTQMVEDRGKGPALALLLGGCVPDTGEILIQRALALKYGAKVAVYDARTSDLQIASDLSVTWLYDTLHSPFVAFMVFLLGYVLMRSYREQGAWGRAGVLVNYFAIGMASQFVLDCATHGKVWALKWLFPLSQTRIPLFVDSLGCWWDWTPKLAMPFVQFSLPLWCLLLWLLFGTTAALLWRRNRAASAAIAVEAASA